MTNASIRKAKAAYSDAKAAAAGVRPNLTDAYLVGANLNRADLTTANLTAAKLNRANLSGADLRYAILTGADLTDANLTAANLTGAKLTGAKLTGANLERAVGIVAWQGGACGPRRRMIRVLLLDGRVTVIAGCLTGSAETVADGLAIRLNDWTVELGEDSARRELADALDLIRVGVAHCTARTGTHQAVAP